MKTTKTVHHITKQKCIKESGGADASGYTEHASSYIEDASDFKTTKTVHLIQNKNVLQNQGVQMHQVTQNMHQDTQKMHQISKQQRQYISYKTKMF